MDEAHRAMLAFATDIFTQGGGIVDPRHPFRDKIGHTRRVIAWVERIAPEEGGDLDLLTTCAIFHDLGYTVSPAEHPAVSAVLCDRYLAGHGYDGSYRARARKIIALHGDKSLLVPETQRDALILIEADNLDEKGALDVLWDAMAEGARPQSSYEETYRRLLPHLEKRRRNIMVTPTARRFWDERLAVLECFVQSLALELGLE
jgi:HD superfamily phosphodiesterase